MSLMIFRLEEECVPTKEEMVVKVKIHIKKLLEAINIVNSLSEMKQRE